jgi:hypothetical protein
MKNILQIVLILIFTGLGTAAFSQNVGINEDGSDPDDSAILDVKSTTKGFLVPRMTTAERTAISTPATGLIVYDTEYASHWYYNGTQWQIMEFIATGADASDVPTNPSEGQLYYDTTGDKLFVYVTTGWAEVTIGTPASSPY